MPGAVRVPGTSIFWGGLDKGLATATGAVLFALAISAQDLAGGGAGVGAGLGLGLEVDASGRGAANWERYEGSDLVCLFD